MARARTLLLTIAALLMLTGMAWAEITVSITSTAPSDGRIAEGESATISWKIEADSESGDWQFEVGGDGTLDSGDPCSSSDAYGTFSGTLQGTSTVKWSDLDSDDGDYTVYFIAQDSSDSTNYDFTSVTITLDNPPDIVTGVSAGNGNQKIFVNWEGLDVSDISYYLIYYSTESGTDAADYAGTDAAEGPSPVDAGDATTFTLSGLQNEVRYYIRVSAVDDGDVEGPLSEEVGSTPRESFGLADSKDEEGGCFIATAAFGNYDHPTVKILRNFRDAILLNSEVGTDFVEAYYKYSPPAAKWLTGHPNVRAFTAAALVPVAWYADASLQIPVMAVILPMLFALFIFGSAGYCFVRIRRRGK